MNYNILRYESLDSTNNKAKEIVEGVPEGTVVLARHQSGARGRMGRSWNSPKDKGLWMSLILKPNISLGDIGKISLIAAATINSALKNLAIESRIKWPNDIIIGDRKVAGILTEIKATMEGMDYIILGIGINLSQTMEDFPEDIRDKAGSLKMMTDRDINIDLLLNKILDAFRNFYESFRERDDISKVLRINRQESILLGREVVIVDPKGKKRRGKALDLSPAGKLLVEFPQGIEEIVAGEVSVRAMEGYI